MHMPMCWQWGLSVGCQWAVVLAPVLCVFLPITRARVALARAIT